MAAKASGWFVYCYLRKHSNLPYYVGLGSPKNPYRHVSKRHTCPVPKDRNRIRILRNNLLTKDQAIYWERFYIARYGRKDLGTGCLMNRTDGGEGCWNASKSIHINRVLLACAKHGICPAIWAGLPKEERRNLGMWLRSNASGQWLEYLNGFRRKVGRSRKASLESVEVLSGEGLTQAQIAQRLGCSQQAVSRAMKELGRPPRAPERVAALKAEILALGAQGLKQSEIAARAGCAQTYVSRVLAGQRQGVAGSQCGRL